MNKRSLGLSGIEVSPLCLGGNVFGWTADENASHRVLDAFVEAGLNFIDTADIYSGWVPGHQGGESELVIGSWLKKSGKRSKVVIATKLGHTESKQGPGLKRENVFTCAEKSLRRLGIETIDVYLSHRDDPATPSEETILAFSELHRAGKIRSIGASDFSIARLQESLAASKKLGCLRYEVVQPEYNLLERAKFEGALATFCADQKIGAMTYFGLARGFLSGKYRTEADLTKSPRGPGVAKYLNPKGLQVLEALDDLASRHRVKPASIAIAWTMAMPQVTSSIASATSVEQLQDLLAATRISLSRDEIELLSSNS